MSTKRTSGKTKFVSGVSRYLWEEMKTMNRAKIKALSKIVSGYIRMKLGPSKKKDLYET